MALSNLGYISFVPLTIRSILTALIASTKCAFLTTNVGIFCDVNLPIGFLITGSGSDFEQYSGVLRFVACQPILCIGITIVDDLVLESLESFNISLEGVGLDSSFFLDPTVAQIDIINDDGEVIMLTTEDVQFSLGLVI